ncbi:hypothetical protein Hanom_Chr04g00339231 [Helianthus anomalus]
MKMARFQTFCIRIRKNKPSDESRKTGQISRTKMTFFLIFEAPFYLFYPPRGRTLSRIDTSKAPFDASAVDNMRSVSELLQIWKWFDYSKVYYVFKFHFFHKVTWLL